jgi:Secretory lipase
MTALLAAAAVVALAATGSIAAAATSGPALPSSDPFYAYTAPLAGVAPGTVLRKRTVTIAEMGNTTPVTATQVLYRTTGQLGQPTVTVATVIQPATEALVTHLVSYQTAYDGLGSECDPSYTLQGGNSGYTTAQDEEQLLLAYVADGDTVVVPDYEGENLDWAAGQESGYGTLDGIRAAEHLLNVPASTPVGMVGYSGGSIATDFAAELASKYAPELNIVGTAMGGIPVDMLHNLDYINGSPSWSGVIPAVLVSLSRAFRISFQPYLSAYGLQVTNQVKADCINNFVGDYPGLTIQKLLGPAYQNPFKLYDFVKIGDELIMGRTGTPKGPLLMGVGNADGTGDGVMIAKDVEALAHTYCERGISVEFNEYSGDDHTQAAVPFEVAAQSFLNSLLSGQSVSNGCSSIAAGNSLTPQPLPPQLTLSYHGVKRSLRGAVVDVTAPGGTLNAVAVTLWRGRRRLDTVKLATLTYAQRRVVLRVNRKSPPAGRYTVWVSAPGVPTISRSVKIG